jgi:glycosyltransferase involved in cell wall biosynthesis
MILALVAPHYFPSVRGNSIDRQDRATILAALARARPDVVHGFHATMSGPLVAEAARRLDIPSTITVTGTDVNQDLLDPVRRPLVREVLEAVQAVVVFHQIIGEKICRHVPAACGKIRVIGQAVLCDGSRFDLRGAAGVHPGDFVFFQSAGLRRVKNIPAVIPWLAALHRRHPDMRYVLAGPVIEPEEATRVTDALRGLPWATYLGALEHEQICAGLSAMQVVVSSSLSEGGMSNAVLEAMSKGIPVLASDIDGHRSVITDGEDGFLFASAAEFQAKAERLLNDPALRVVMGHRARRKIAAHFRLEGEVDGYLALYRDLAAGRGG